MKMRNPKKIRIIIWIGALIGLFILGFGKGLDNSRLAVTGSLIVLVVVVFQVAFYRCPCCGKYLGKHAGNKCPFCGKDFNEL